MTVFGVDISNHQAGISIEQIAAEGYQYAICKASQGTYFRDGWFDGWIPRIRAAGMTPGAYHWLENGDGGTQAKILYGRLVDHGGPSGFLVACDNEDNADWATTDAFVQEWAQVSGGHPLLMYSGRWWWAPRGWNGAAWTPHLWLSRYVAGSGYGSALYGDVADSWWSPGFGGWGEATVLQFSSSARVAGYSIDVNAFRGAVDDLRALTSTGGTAPTIGDAMAGMDSLDPFGPGPDGVQRTFGAMLRDLTYTALMGANPGGTSEGGIVPRLQRIEDAIGRLDDATAPRLDLTAEQFEILRADMRAAAVSAVQPLMQALGEAGDAIGRLNDTPAAGS